MNMNYSYQVSMYESILAQMCVFLVLFTIFAFYHEKFLKPKLQIYFSTRNMYIWAKNTLIHCSHRTVAHVHVNVFFKIHQACHSDANGIKPGSNQK